MTDHVANLENTLMSKPEPPSFIKRTIAPAPSSELSRLDRLALDIIHLEYLEMIEWMSKVHSQTEALFQAKAMQDWALDRLEKKTST